MSTTQNFYGNTPDEANKKAQLFIDSLASVQQPSLQPARHAPATIRFMPDGSTIEQFPQGKWLAVVHYWGCD